MKVYAVEYEGIYDDHWVEGIFSTYEKAKEVCTELNDKSDWTPNSYTVQIYLLDSWTKV